MTHPRPILLDVTRLVAFRWSGGCPTGIDRVCIAYLEHYATRAHAVFQFRGFFRVLDARQSDRLFALLARRTVNFRSRFLPIATQALTRASARVTEKGKFYINASHTDFDLASHIEWVRSSNLRSIYLIHDLIPISHSSHCRPRAVTRHLGRVVNSLRHATGIIVNSDHTRDELVNFANTNGHRIPPIVSAPLGGAKLPSVHPAADVQDRYFLCIGTIEPRKNHKMLLRVWQRMARRSGNAIPRLIVIGRWGAQSKEVRAFIRRDAALARHVTILDHCSDAEMADWIAGARAVLLPTRAEGYGLPLVEAMAMGAPVVASDLPAFRQIGKGIPLLLDPDDEAAWTHAIMTLESGEDERHRQIELLTEFRPPVWQDHFVQVDAWLDALETATTIRRPIRPSKISSRSRSFPLRSRRFSGSHGFRKGNASMKHTIPKTEASVDPLAPVYGSTEPEKGWREKARFLFRQPLFVFTVLLPTVLAILYFGIFAEDVYISESRFVVRNPQKTAASPLSAVLSGSGIANGSEESAAVMEYVQSRRALEDVNRDGLVLDAYADPDIFFLDRFGALGGSSREQLYQYFIDKVAIAEGASTQVATLTVRAYTPVEAQKINARLLNQSEELVNSLSQRAQQDSIQLAQREVDAANANARDAALRLAEFRDRNGLVDPAQQSEIGLQMISKLQDELIAARTQLQQLQTYTPEASQIPFLQSQIASIQREINLAEGQLAGGNRSLSAALVKYQELRLNSEFAEQQRAIVLASLQEAQVEARRKRAYVERISSPSLPDYAEEPHRIRGIIATLIMGLLAWGVLSMLIVGIREHRD